MDSKLNFLSAYSQVRNVDIFLQCNDNIVQLISTDDNIGFNSKQTHNCIGLSNIYERVLFYSGIVDIQTS